MILDKNGTSRGSDMKRVSDHDKLMNNPHIQGYSIKTESMGEITKPVQTSTRKPLRTVADVKKFIQENPLGVKKVFSDRVICIELDSSDEGGFNATDSGLYVPGNTNKKVVHGRMGERMVSDEHKWADYVVVFVGEGYILDNGKRKEMEIKLWDKVRIGHWMGYMQDINGIEVKLVRDLDCQFSFTDEKN